MTRPFLRRPARHGMHHHIFSICRAKMLAQPPIDRRNLIISKCDAGEGVRVCIDPEGREHSQVELCFVALAGLAVLEDSPIEEEGIPAITGPNANRNASKPGGECEYG